MAVIETIKEEDLMPCWIDGEFSCFFLANLGVRARCVVFVTNVVISDKNANLGDGCHRPHYGVVIPHLKRF